MNDSLYLLAESYNSHKILRLLVKLIPRGGIVDSSLSSYYTKEKEKRVTTFFDELAKNETPLTEDIINSDDFLHKYFITLKAVIETKRTEKIRYFARLLNNCNTSLINDETDNFEDFIKILDDLTFQEIQILSIIRECDRETNDESIDFNRKMTGAISFYKKIKENISIQLRITEDEVRSHLNRLERTGCVFYQKAANEKMFSVVTTSLYHKLEWLAISDND